MVHRMAFYYRLCGSSLVENYPRHRCLAILFRGIPALVTFKKESIIITDPLMLTSLPSIDTDF